MRRHRLSQLGQQTEVGRDLSHLEALVALASEGAPVTIAGRYLKMDRDNRRERVAVHLPNFAIAQPGSGEAARPRSS